MALNVVNLLATSRFAEYIDLDHFSIETGLDFDPDRFPGMTFKIDDPRVCALIFRSGRIVITGAKTVADIETALDITYKSLIEHNCALWNTYEYALGNVVVTHDLKRELNLAHLTLSLPMARTEWEPEQFPGLIYRLGGLSAVCLIFSSGKCVITGNNSLEDAQEAVDTLIADLDEV
ncbi:MAG: TATA-box-binding protein [Candidatus Marinimicrobia bacterium]|jgi:transcription initiation factor TFIID TATA-box-binding protein|nr:TATA-box-binding protein [Candidatus Neomarinimicrobiota bacterium]MBT5995114.1 TATA-box-binding protein [Candidatus Neomarinimicrobiota bacterium]